MLIMVLVVFFLPVILRCKMLSLYILGFSPQFLKRVHVINHLINISGQGWLLHGRCS